MKVKIKYQNKFALTFKNYKNLSACQKWIISQQELNGFVEVEKSKYIRDRYILIRYTRTGKISKKTYSFTENDFNLL